MANRHHHYVVILAGGEGTRFAPLSTPDKPKQFLNIVDPSRTMIQQTFDRISPLVPIERLFISISEKYSRLVADQLPDVPRGHVLGEPLKKNTAPAIALATAFIHSLDPDAVILFAPSDHFIFHEHAAIGVFEDAYTVASTTDDLVVFGVTPEFASSDYGYIQRDGKASSLKMGRVKRFVEKPDIVTAQRYLKEGNYFWNSGIFVWKARVFLEALRRYKPQIADQLDTRPNNTALDPNWVQHFFEEVESISVDYAVMEKAENVSVLPFDVGWSDVGTWQGLSQVASRYGLYLPDEVRTFLESKNYSSKRL